MLRVSPARAKQRAVASPGWASSVYGKPAPLPFASYATPDGSNPIAVRHDESQ
jgi:hypothetical protein